MIRVVEYDRAGDCYVPAPQEAVEETFKTFCDRMIRVRFHNVPILSVISVHSPLAMVQEEVADFMIFAFSDTERFVKHGAIDALAIMVRAKAKAQLDEILDDLKENNVDGSDTQEAIMFATAAAEFDYTPEIVIREYADRIRLNGYAEIK